MLDILQEMETEAFHHEARKLLCESVEISREQRRLAQRQEQIKLRVAEIDAEIGRQSF